MYEPELLILLFLLGCLTGFINVMAGGGSALTLPLLLLMGLDAPMANGTNRVAIFALTLSAVRSMQRENVSDFKFSLKMAIFTLPGAILGAYLANGVGNETFKEILAWVMIGIIIMIIIPQSKKEVLISRLKKYPKLIYVSMLFLGFYGGFIQVGIGFLLMLALQSILDLNLIKVNMHKVFIVLIYTIPALGIFFWQGNVNIILGLILAAGMSIGAWWSAKYAIKKGDKIVRWFLIISIVLISLKLFDVY